MIVVSEESSRMKLVSVQLKIAADSQLPNSYPFGYRGRCILAEPANFQLVLSKFLVHFQFHQKSGMEAQTRLVQQAALAKKSAVIKG